LPAESPEWKYAWYPVPQLDTRWLHFLITHSNHQIKDILHVSLTQYCILQRFHWHSGCAY